MTRSPRHRRGDEGGQATTELVLATPALLLLCMLLVQVGLWFHASHVVRAAAQEGARAARIEQGTEADGRARVQSFLAAVAPRLIESVTIQVDRDADTARVEVRGQVLPVVPFVDFAVTAVSEGPVERFRPVTEG